jgi:hypothetical protein
MNEKFSLTQALIVVWFDATGKGIRQLPVGTMLTLTGRASLPGFIEIMHAGELYHSFEDDFRDRSQHSAANASRTSFECPSL